jgi:uncharacterized protein
VNHLNNGTFSLVEEAPEPIHPQDRQKQGSATNGTVRHRVKRGRKKREPSSFLEVRQSDVHGQGVFATKSIRKGKRIIEYTGKRMPWDVASADSDDPHTFLFGFGDGNDVINAGIDGNEARWINHSCDPNCEAVEERNRIFIYALRDIHPGEELSYDYALEIDEPRSEENEKEHACSCGASNCRGTLLAAESKNSSKP